MEQPRPTGNFLAELPDSISVDDALSALAHPLRRQLLVVLHQPESPERLPALSRSLAAETDHASAENVDQLHVLLYHCHVPKLAEAGIVTYDDEQDTVDLTDGGRPLADALAR